jgi:alpha-beta hydrolase superfamily lysophospholipase
MQSFEKRLSTRGVLSDATPADLGIEFERVSIASGTRVLDGFLVRADAGCGKSAAVLIFHGRDETIADWIKAQRTLRKGCVSSLVFDYSGHGRSSATGTVAHLNEDSVAAYGAFLHYFPAAERRCLLGHSMGGGPLLYAATNAPMTPDGVILAKSVLFASRHGDLGRIAKVAGVHLAGRLEQRSCGRPSPLTATLSA